MRLTRKSALALLMIILFLGSTLVTLSSMFLGEDEGEERRVVTLETSKGVIKLELDADRAPMTVANFVQYVEDGFYDSTVFHRVIPGFMIQGGGYAPDGSGEPTREPIELESANGLKNRRGAIAMARTMVADSATSQFFINLVDNDFLDHAPGNEGYAVFGRVVDGMDVVDAIAVVETGTRGYFEDWPVEDIVIIRAFFED
jgi:cyclophilin family peptidyl-prolyl cis-trans isomerase